MRHDVTVTGRFTVKAAEPTQQLVFGWANIAIAKGENDLNVDSWGETIDPADLEQAAYRFVRTARASGQDHDPTYATDGILVESMVITDEKLTALATDPVTGDIDTELETIMKDRIARGWWVGFHLPDPEAFARSRTSHTEFSIEGTATVITDDEPGTEGGTP